MLLTKDKFQTIYAAKITLRIRVTKTQASITNSRTFLRDTKKSRNINQVKRGMKYQPLPRRRKKHRYFFLPLAWKMKGGTGNKLQSYKKQVSFDEKFGDKDI